MRISDWSSDVCSSDLKPAPAETETNATPDAAETAEAVTTAAAATDLAAVAAAAMPAAAKPAKPVETPQIRAGHDTAAADRKSVVEGKEGAVRVKLGGRRHM